MITFRRRYLDLVLRKHAHLMRGEVLDIGGKKINKRGDFRPPTAGIESWRYANPDVSVEPDFHCGAESLPLPESSIDTIIMTEVLEYLQQPAASLTEIARVLRPGGRAFISVPFLLAVHNDHNSDCFRMTAKGLRSLMESSGLKVESIVPMGGLGAVIHDLLHVQFGYASRRNGFGARLFRRLLRISTPLFLFAERKGEGSFHINTGYFAVGTVPMIEGKFADGG